MLYRAFAGLAVVAMLVVSAHSVAADDKADTHDGKVVKVDGDKLVMTDKAGKEHTHLVGNAAKVIVDGKDAKLSDLKPGQEITVTTEKKEITKIEAKK